MFKQVGNLAIICAQRPDVRVEIKNGHVFVTIGKDGGDAFMSCPWHDDTLIDQMICELNFGIYS